MTWAVVSSSALLRLGSPCKVLLNHSPPAEVGKSPTVPLLSIELTDESYRLKQPELLHEGQLTWSISQFHRGQWEQESPVCTKLLWLTGCLLPQHSPILPDWQNKLSGHSQGTTTPSNITFPTFFHISPKRSTYMLLSSTSNLRLCFSPLHYQAHKHQMHRHSVLTFYWWWWKSKQMSNIF
jgi:hypothetical protein